MSRKKYKKRDKITQKMSRDGLVQRNEATGEDIRISKRDTDYDFRGDIQNAEAFEIGTDVKRSSGLSQLGTRTAEAPSKNATYKKRATYRHAAQEQANADVVNPNAETQPSPPSQNFTQKNLENLRDAGHVDDEILPHAENPPEAPAQQNTGSKFTQEGKKSLYQNERPPALSFTTQAGNSPLKHNLQAATSALMLEKHADTSNTRSPPPPPAKNKKRRPKQDAKLTHGENTALQHKTDEPQSPLTHRGEFTDISPEDNSPTATETQSAPSSQRLNKPVTTEQSEADTTDVFTDGDKSPTSNSRTDKNSSSSRATLNTKPETALEQKKTSKLKFSDDEATPVPRKDRKLIKAERQFAQANAKLEKAQNNLPAKRTLHTERGFDEKKGKASTKICFDKEIKSQAEHAKGALPLRPIKAATNAVILKAHAKIYQVENENVAVKAAHKGELAGEGAVRSALRFHKNAPFRKVARLEKQATKKSMNLAYRKALAENPKLKSNFLSRMIQKQKIRRQYAKAARDTKKAATGVKNAGKLVARVKRALKFAAKFLLKNPKVLLILALIGVIVILLMSMFSLGASIFGGGFTSIVASSHLSDDADIEQVALTFSEWEAALRMQIIDAEANHDGFDEFIFNTGAIGHCPLELMAYLTAVHHIFEYADISAHLHELFAEQYQLEFVPSVEIRQRWVTHIDPATGEPYSVLESYAWNIMTVTLTSRSFNEVIMSRMTIDQQEHFAMLMQTNGNRQMVGSPFDFNWRPFISSHFGWRVHPIFGGKSMHNGIDIGLPTGTEIRAAHDGVITFAGYTSGYGNFIIIDRGDGIVTRYAHCDTILVTVGQEVTAGDVIGTVGSTGDSTGPHLHFEILYHGEFRNPAFFAHMG
jgi:hypothetical protein